MRFDNFIAQKLNISRNHAKELISSKNITLNDHFFKASFNVKTYLLGLTKDKNEDLLETKLLSLKLLKELFVSRGAFKLQLFLQKHKEIQIYGKNCLDIGSSTGGFVQILLQNEALSVLGIDVGKDQLHKSLRKDQRLSLLENTDFRDFKSDKKFDLITCDISFISLCKIIKHINSLYFNDLILLFKPQFEVGKEIKRNAKGVVKDEKAIIFARKNFEKECLDLGWILKTSEECEFKGKEGNIEYFYHYKKS